MLRDFYVQENGMSRSHGCERVAMYRLLRAMAALLNLQYELLK
ncbi:MAG: hypothetical protein ACI971_001207 [Colwellia sp.]|jgi:hypothetical protein